MTTPEDRLLNAIFGDPADLDPPQAWIGVTSDPRTGEQGFTGPFATEIDAACWAERTREDYSATKGLVGDDDISDVRITIKPLYMKVVKK